MKNVSIKALTAQVLEQLQILGIPQKRLRDYKCCGFGEVTKYFTTQGSTIYSTAMMNACMEHFRELYEKEGISRWKWQQIRKAATWLQEFHISERVTLAPLTKWEVLHNPLHREPTQEELLDHENLFGLVHRTKQELMTFNLSEKTICNYTYDGFDSILRYCIQHDITKYSKTSLEVFVANARFAHENHQLCRSVYQTVRKTVSLLEECHDTGKLDWHYLPAWGTKALTPLFSSAVDDYCKTYHRRQALADGTIATNKSAIRQFLFCAEEMGIYDFSGITHRVVNDCITILAPKYPHGMKNCISAVCSFLNFLYDKGLTAEPLRKAIPETSAPRRAIRHGFTPEELERLLSCTDRSTTVGKRDYAMMLLAIQTGLRVVDISGLVFQNIDWHGSEIRVAQHKTGRALSMPMEPAVGNAIADYILNGRPKCECSFVFLSKDSPHRRITNRSASSIVCRYMEKCEIDRVKIPRRGFHSFRRSFGARLLQSEIPLEMLSEMLGHSSIDSSRPYVAVDETGLRSCAIGLSGLEAKAGELQW